MRTNTSNCLAAVGVIAIFLVMQGCLGSRLPPNISAADVYKYYTDIEKIPLPLYYGVPAEKDSDTPLDKRDILILIKIEKSTSKTASIRMTSKSYKGDIQEHPAESIGFIALTDEASRGGRYYLVHTQFENKVYFVKLDGIKLYLLNEIETKQAEALRAKYGRHLGVDNRSVTYRDDSMENVIGYFKEVVKNKYVSEDIDSIAFIPLTSEQYAMRIQ